MVESAVVRGAPSESAVAAVGVFEKHADALAAAQVTTVPQVLDVIRADLQRLRWKVSSGTGKPAGVQIGRTTRRPVLADGFHDGGVVLWVELGRSWANFGFLEHAIEAGFVPLVTDVVIAVRHRWDGRVTYENCVDFLLDLEESNVSLPYGSLTVVGF